MNILFFHSIAIAPDKGGIERWAAAVTGEFELRGNACLYLAAKPIWKEFSDARRQFFLPNAHRFDCTENAIFFETLLREKKIDIVLFLWADGKRFPAAFAKICRDNAVPVVATIHTDPCFYERRFRGNNLTSRIKRFLRFRRQAKIYRKNARACNATVLLSDRFKNGFLKHFSRERDAGTLFAIPNPSAYPSQTIDFSAKKKELLFVGRMEMSVKQPQLLLKIWASLSARFPEWRFRLVGGGYDFEKIRALAGTLGLQRVFFEGFQKPEKYYRDAAVFCMTSAYEGFGMVLVEAAAFGCVPVAFDSFAAVHDIIDDGENGRLVPAFDSDKYAETLAGLMRDDALRERLARNAHAIPEKFSPKIIAVRWLGFLEEILKTSTRERIV